MTLDDLLKESAQAGPFFCDRHLFPVVNRLLNEKGYALKIVEAAAFRDMQVLAVTIETRALT